MVDIGVCGSCGGLGVLKDGCGYIIPLIWHICVLIFVGVSVGIR